jgi:hypothetical protein
MGAAVPAGSSLEGELMIPLRGALLETPGRSSPLALRYRERSDEENGARAVAHDSSGRDLIAQRTRAVISALL